MSSIALGAFLQSVEEVRILANADPTRPGKLPKDPAAARAIGRACVVLLVGHLEGYLSAVNQELVDALNVAAPASERFGTPLKLRHSRSAIDKLAATGWPSRASGLQALARDEMWLWSPGATGPIDHERLLEGVTSPMPEDLVRYFGLWGVEDVFTAVTRKKTTRSALWLGIQDVVSKRHAIAHGDPTAEATKLDVVGYVRVVERLAKRSDALLRRHVMKSTAVPPPW